MTSNKLKIYELGEVINSFDSLRVPVKKPDRKTGPYPYYGASGIVDYVDDFIFDGEYLLIGEDGKNLRSKKTPLAFIATGKFWVNNHAHVIQGNEKADTRYLMYLINTLDISGFLTGSTMPKLTQQNLHRIKVSLPPLEIQFRIAEILSSFDKKIELNENMNHTLEEIARTIFQSWFVNFDPVRAKAEGRDTGLPAEIADLFPDGFEDSAVGEIPSGWKVATLKDISHNPREIINPQDFMVKVPYIGLEHMPQGSISLEEWGSSEKVNSSKYKFCKGDFLFGKLRPYFRKVGVAPLDGVCSTDILVIKPYKSYYYSYLLEVISSEEFIRFTDAASTGTKMPRTNWKDMGDYRIVMPSKSLLEYFDYCVKPFTQYINKNIEENFHLKNLRDVLLPKLLTEETVIGGI